MEQEILNNIYRLYRGRIIDLILYVLFSGVTVLVIIGAIKWELIESKVERILMLIICVSTIALPVMEFSTETAPVRADYKESSYIVLENATMTVTTDTETSGVLRRVNHVIVIDNDGKCYDLMVDHNNLISRGDKYTGTIVYLKHSNYVIWFAFATKQ